MISPKRVAGPRRTGTGAERDLLRRQQYVPVLGFADRHCGMTELGKRGNWHPGSRTTGPRQGRAIPDRDTALNRPGRTIGAGPQGRHFVRRPDRPATGAWLAAWLLAAALLGGAALGGAGAAEVAGPRATACAAAEAPAGPRLRVTVIGARKVAGNVTITVYGPRPEDFLARGGRLARQRILLQGLAAEACFALSEVGAYAIVVYHDENNDHDFNRTSIGMPAEGYGFSNDAPALIGVPRFEAARFTVPAGGSQMTIRLRY